MALSCDASGFMTWVPTVASMLLGWVLIVIPREIVSDHSLSITESTLLLMVAPTAVLTAVDYSLV